jgi:polyphosphate:AMP phosphotransferase
MLEQIDLDQAVSKEQCEQQFPPLELRLGELQRAVRGACVPVIVIFEGWEAAGKGRAINRLALAMDPRGFYVYSTAPATEIDRFYPWLKRFWNALPAAGQVGIFDQSWYDGILRQRLDDDASDDECRKSYEQVREFERQLTDDGTVIVKFWLHIGKKEQKKRLAVLASDPATSWRVAKWQRRQNRDYKQWVGMVEEMLRETSTDAAPWTVIAATDERNVRVQVFQTIVRAVEAELQRRETAGRAPRECPAEPPAAPAGPTVLDRVDLSVNISREDYDKEVDDLQKRLFELEHRLYEARIPAVIAYEGWDAAGKGGNIKRLARGLDPRGYEVIPIAAPTAEEKAHHYLWRFWRRVPKAGHIAVFDRTWYGRVLVERVESFCREPEWRRAYGEINEFERQLADYGTVIVKFWLQIDQDEQLRRFQQRQQTPLKQWKITDEDWRNREKWDRYAAAVVEMIEKTSTGHAPWTILEANSKLYARIKALRTVADALERALQKARK